MRDAMFFQVEPFLILNISGPSWALTWANVAIVLQVIISYNVCSDRGPAFYRTGIIDTICAEACSCGSPTGTPCSGGMEFLRSHTGLAKTNSNGERLATRSARGTSPCVLALEGGIW